MAETPNKNPKTAPKLGNPSKPGVDSSAEIPVESSDAFVDFGSVASIRDGASGVIPISELPLSHEPPSVVSWADVIRQQRELSQGNPAPAGEALKIDSISDLDLRKQFESMMPANDASGGDFDATALFGAKSMANALADAQASHVDLQASGRPAEESSGSRVHFGHAAGEEDAPASGNISFTIRKPPADAGGAIQLPTDYDLLLGRASSDDLPTFSESADIGGPPGADAAEDGSSIYFGGSVPGRGQAPSSHDHNVLFGDDLPTFGNYAAGSAHGDEADIGTFQPPGADPETPSAAVRSSILDILLTNPNDPADDSGSSSNVFGPSGKMNLGQPGGDSDYHPDPHAARDPGRPQSNGEFFLPEAAAMAGNSRGSTADYVAGVRPPADAIGSRSRGEIAPESAGASGAESPYDDAGEYEGEGAVDLYAGQALESELTASGTFKVSDADLELAQLRQKIMESSAVDLSSNPSFNSFNLGARKKAATPLPDSDAGLPANPETAYAEPVARYKDAAEYDPNTPSDEDVDNSMIRRLEEMASQEDFVLGDNLAMGRRDLLEAYPNRDPVNPSAGGDAFKVPNKLPRERPGSSKEIVIPGDDPNRISAADLQPERAKAPYRPQEATQFPETGAARRKPGSRLFVGGFAGLALGAGGMFGAYAAGLLPETGTETKIAQTQRDSAYKEQMLLEERYTAQIKGMEAADRDLLKQLGSANPKEALVNLAAIQKARNTALADRKEADGARDLAKADLAKAKEEARKAAVDLQDAKLREEKAIAQVAKLEGEMRDMASPNAEIRKKYEAALADAEKKSAALKAEEVKAAELAKGLESKAALLKQIEDKLVASKVVSAGGDAKSLVAGIEALASRGNPPAGGMAADKQLAELKRQREEAEEKLAKFRTSMDADRQKSEMEVAALKTDIEKAKFDLAAAQKSYREEQEKVAANRKQMDEMREAMARAGGGAGAGNSLDAWLIALKDPANKSAAGPALEEANRVAADPKSTADDRSKAQAVKVLAHRSRGDAEAARTALADLQKQPGYQADGGWMKDLKATLAPIGDPAAAAAAIKTDLPPAVQLERLDEVLKHFAGESTPAVGTLYARRGILKLDAGDLIQARRDAESALKCGAAPEGQLGLARVLEREGKFAEAEKGYRAVLAMPDARPGLQSQALLGLGRVLNHTADSDSTSRAAPPGGTSLRQLPPEALLLLLLTGVEFPESPDDGDRIAESIKIADKLIADGENLGHLIKADALARLKKYPEALREYSLGIDRLKVLPREYEGILDRILVGLPALQKIEVRASNDGDIRSAERLYGEGLGHFNAGRFSEAEACFARSVRDNVGDARLYYYLGLSRLALGQTDQAHDDFRTGGLLEQKGSPPSKTVNASLERVQGATRQVLNQFRP